MTVCFHDVRKATTVQFKKLLKNIIEKAETNHGFICVTNYVSENGRRCNYVLQPYGSDAYHRLVEESLIMLERGICDLPNRLDGEEISQNIWNEAILEQIASFRQTLDGGHGKADNKVKIAKGFYEQNGSIYVTNVRIIKVHETKEQRQYNSRICYEKDKPKSLKAKAKRYLRDITPVGNYRGQFRLDADKFDKIAFSGTSIEFSDYGRLIAD